MLEIPTQSAPVWRRLAALVYDSFILLAISFIYGAAITAISAANHQPETDYQPMFNGVLFPLGWCAALVLFYCWFWSKSGQTLGMKTWKIKLVQKQNALNPKWSQCLLRCLLTPPLVLGFGVGYWYAYSNQARESLQDRLTKTRVIFIPNK